MSEDRNLKTNGFILKKIDFAETDRIFIIFTQELGKISAIAKGVKKIKSKIGGHIEFFTKTKFELYKSHSSELYKLTGAENLVVNQNLIDNLEIMQKGYSILGLLNKFIEEKYPLPKIFELTEKSFFTLNQYPENELIVILFQIKFFTLLGILPSLDTCLKCEKKLSPEAHFFDPNDLGFICKNCHFTKTLQPTNFSIIKILNYFQKGDFNLATQLKLSPTELNNLAEISKIILKTMQTK